MEANVAINPVYYPYLKDERRLQIFYGGSSSGKSFFLCQRIILDLLEGKRNYLVIRNVMATIRLSTFNELTKAILAMNVQNYFNINMSNLTITCKLNNKQIMFYGCDQIEKVKSITPKDGVLTDIFIEEATEVDYNSYKQLITMALYQRMMIIYLNTQLTSQAEVRQVKKTDGNGHTI